MSLHRQMEYGGRHRLPRNLSTRTVWYLLGIAVVAFWALVIALVVLG